MLVSTPVVFFQFFQRQAFLSFAANRLKMPQKTRKRERRREKEKEKISIFNLFPKSFSRGFKVNGSHCAPAHPKTYKRQTHLAHTLREGSNSSLVYLDATLLLVIPRHLACLCWRPLVSFLGPSESTVRLDLVLAARTTNSKRSLEVTETNETKKNCREQDKEGG